MGYDQVLVLDQGRLVEKGCLEIFPKTLLHASCPQEPPTNCSAQEEYLKAWPLRLASKVEKVLKRLTNKTVSSSNFIILLLDSGFGEYTYVNAAWINKLSSESVP